MYPSESFRAQQFTFKEHLIFYCCILILLTDYNYEQDSSYQNVKKFLDEIPQDLLAVASMNCGAYTRSLRHLEQYIQGTDNLHGQLDALQVGLTRFTLL